MSTDEEHGLKKCIMKLVKLLLLIFISLLYSPYPYGNDIPSDVTELYNSIVRLQINGGQWQGTGFIIRQDILVTNAHMLLNEDGLVPLEEVVIDRIGEYENISIKITELKALSLMHDLALFEVSSYNGPALTIERLIPEDRVYAIGFKEGDLSIIKGNPVRDRNVNDYGFFTNTSYIGGASGAPVFNSKSQVIGIISKGIDYSVSATKSVYLENLLLNSYNDNRTGAGKSNQIFEEEINRIHLLGTYDKIAQYILGQMYFAGVGVKQDYKKAMEYYTQSANQGYIEAQSELGVIYYNKQDYKQAIEYFTLSADQGDLKAAFNLAFILYKGELVEQNDFEARKWFTLVSDHGFLIAQYILGMMYYRGEGGPKDYYEAWKLFTLSAEQGHPEASQIMELLNQNESYEDWIYRIYRSTMDYFFN